MYSERDEIVTLEIEAHSNYQGCTDTTRIDSCLMSKDRSKASMNFGTWMIWLSSYTELNRWHQSVQEDYKQSNAEMPASMLFDYPVIQIQDVQAICPVPKAGILYSARIGVRIEIYIIDDKEF